MPKPVPPCPILEEGQVCGKPAPYVTPQICCRMHYSRWRSHGHVLSRIRIPDVQPALQAAADATTDDCIRFPGQQKRRPIVRINNTTMWASRAVWILANGDPGPLQVLHSCNGGSGTSGCINLRHLYLGTAARNTQDCIEAGRHPSLLRGDAKSNARLSEAQVREIRRRISPGRGGNTAALAAEYGVSLTTIRHIVSRRKWAWLD